MVRLGSAVTAMPLHQAVEHLEDYATVGGGQPLDLLETLEQSCGARTFLFFGRLEAEELIGRDAKRLGEVDEHGAWGLCVFVLVVSDDAAGDAGGLGELSLGHAAALSDLGEAITEAFEGALFHR